MSTLSAHELDVRAGELVARSREDAGINLTGAAERVGITAETLADMEAGKRPIPIDVFHDLCVLYGVDDVAAIKEIAR